MVDLTKKYLYDENFPLMNSPYDTTEVIPSTTPPVATPELMETPAAELTQAANPTEQPTIQPAPAATPVEPRLSPSKLSQVLQSLRGRANPDLSIYDKMQEELSSARGQNEEALKNARLRDSTSNMYSGISAGVNQIAQGLANRAGITDIKMNPFKYDANRATEVGTDNKAKLDALMEKYKLASDKEKARMDAENRKNSLEVQIAQAQDADTLRRDLAKEKAQLARETAKEKAESKKDNSEEAKLRLEEKKNDLRIDKEIQKENRAERKKLDADLGKSEALLKDLKTAKTLFENYSKNSKTGGTGPVATLGGLTAYLSEDAQNLKAALNKVSLESLVSMFSGMSKAVDTGAERQAFESTQPALGLDDTVNERLLKERIEAVERMIKKQKSGMDKYDRYGRFTDEEEPSQNINTQNTSIQENKSEFVTMISPNGKEVQIPKDKVDAALKAGGKLK